jgi:hypothetical protein
VPGIVNTTKEFARLPFSIRRAEAERLRIISEEAGRPVGAGIDCCRSTFGILGKDAEKSTNMYHVHGL